MQPYIGEMKMFGGNFAPRGWAFCNGQLLPISGNDALFSLLGTIYGGDGRTTFALPDMRGRSAIQQGDGPGLSARPLGQKSGTEYNYLTANNLPPHTHTPTLTGEVKIPVSGNSGASDNPAGNYPAVAGDDFYASNPSPGAFMAPINTSGMGVAVGTTGASQAVNNMMPSTTVNYIIALVGIYPSRS